MAKDAKKNQHSPTNEDAPAATSNTTPSQEEETTTPPTHPPPHQEEAPPPTMTRFVEQTTLELPLPGNTTRRSTQVTLTQAQLLAMTAAGGGDEEEEEDEDNATTATTIIDPEKQERMGSPAVASSKGQRLLPDSKGDVGSMRTDDVPLLEATVALASTTPGAQYFRNNNTTTTMTSSNTTSTHRQDEGDQDETSMGAALTATVVTHEELEARIRQQVLSEAVVAQVVVMDDENPPPSPPLAQTAKTEETAATAANAKTSSREPQKWKWIVISLTIGLICIGIAIILGLTLSSSRGNDDGNSNDGDDRVSPQEGFAAQKEERAPAWWIEVSPEIITEGSPQRRAFEWMIRNNKVDEEDRFRSSTFAQTYALATFYYATGGPNWLRSDNWMDPNVPVCQWYPGDMCGSSNSNTTTTTDPPQSPTDNNGNIRKRRNLQSRRMKEGGSGSGGSGGGGASRKPKICKLDLPNNGLVGELPDEISLLSGMDEMDLSFNELTGPLRGLGSLFRNGLQNVRLEGNPLTGKVPSAICSPFLSIAPPSVGEFAMDCLDPEIDCPCCTICCLNGSSCETQDF